MEQKETDINQKVTNWITNCCAFSMTSSSSTSAFTITVQQVHIVIVSFGSYEDHKDFNKKYDVSIIIIF